MGPSHLHLHLLGPGKEDAFDIIYPRAEVGRHDVGAKLSDLVTTKDQGLPHLLLRHWHHRQPGLPSKVPGLLQGPNEEEMTPGPQQCGDVMQSPLEASKIWAHSLQAEGRDQGVGRQRDQTGSSQGLGLVHIDRQDSLHPRSKLAFFLLPGLTVQGGTRRGSGLPQRLSLLQPPPQPPTATKLPVQLSPLVLNEAGMLTIHTPVKGSWLLSQPESQLLTVDFQEVCHGDVLKVGTGTEQLIYGGAGANINENPSRHLTWWSRGRDNQWLLPQPPLPLVLSSALLQGSIWSKCCADRAPLTRVPPLRN